jgi:hypothetical protein
MYSSTLSLTSALVGWVVNVAPGPLYLRERLGTLCIGGWLAQGRSGPFVENPASTKITSPDRPARSEPLYRLSHLGQLIIYYINKPT